MDEPEMHYSKKVPYSVVFYVPSFMFLINFKSLKFLSDNIISKIRASLFLLSDEQFPRVILNCEFTLSGALSVGIFTPGLGCFQ